MRGEKWRRSKGGPMTNQKRLVQRIERMLEDGAGDVFARVFGGSVVPEEVEALLRREASDGMRPLAGDRLLTPNEYIITLGGSDFVALQADSGLTTRTFARHLSEYIRDQGWQTYGDVVVRLEQSPNLRTGQYRARALVNPDARPDAAPEADPRASAPPAKPGQSTDAHPAESGAPAMSDNPGYRGDQGQGRPGDEYYDDQYGRPHEDQHPAAPDQQRGYPPNYDQGHPPRPSYPDQGYNPGQGGQSYEQRPPGPGYGAPGGAPGYDQHYRPPAQPYPGPPPYGPPPGAGYPPPPPASDYDYGRPRHDEPGRGRHEPRPAYPDQQQGYGSGFNRPEYGQQPGQQEYGRQPEYGRYDQGGYPPAAPAGEYDYAPPAGQQADYGGYPPAASAGTATLQLDDGSGRTYQLREGANVIGRGQDAQFRLPDTGVSRRHLEIRWDGNVALLSDLNSTNGTTVNNAPVQEWQLADGDVIRVGHSEIIVHLR